MKILYIHQYFNTPETGGPLRSWHLSKALAEAGFEVEVITAKNSKEFSSENINGVKVHYLPVTYDQSYSSFKRIKSFLSFVLKAHKLAVNINADLIYASSTPLTVGINALYLKLKLNKPYIFEVRDLWPDAPIQLGFIKNSLLKKLLTWLEKKVYSNSSGIVALSHPMANHVHSLVPDKPVRVLTNISDVDFFQRVDAENDLRKEYSGKFIISYIGSTGFANNLKSVLNVAEYFQQQNVLNVLFVIAGKGSQLSELKKTVEEKKLKNVQFLPYQKREGLRKLLQVTDLCYVSFRPEPVLRTGSPNKLF